MKSALSVMSLFGKKMHTETARISLSYKAGYLGLGAVDPKGWNLFLYFDFRKKK